MLVLQSVCQWRTVIWLDPRRPGAGTIACAADTDDLIYDLTLTSPNGLRFLVWDILNMAQPLCLRLQLPWQNAFLGEMVTKLMCRWLKMNFCGAT